VPKMRACVYVYVCGQTISVGYLVKLFQNHLIDILRPIPNTYASQVTFLGSGTYGNSLAPLEHYKTLLKKISGLQ
jgi:hypothetical protein